MAKSVIWPKSYLKFMQAISKMVHQIWQKLLKYWEKKKKKKSWLIKLKSL